MVAGTCKGSILTWCIVYSIQLLRALLMCGVPVDVRDSSEASNTLLHWAGSYSTVQIVQMLCGN